MAYNPKWYVNWRESELLCNIVRYAIIRITAELNGSDYFKSAIIGSRYNRLVAMTVLKYEGIVELWSKNSRTYKVIDRQKLEELKREICGMEVKA